MPELIAVAAAAGLPAEVVVFLVLVEWALRGG